MPTGRARVAIAQPQKVGDVLNGFARAASIARASRRPPHRILIVLQGIVWDRILGQRVGTGLEFHNDLVIHVQM
eukprot:COSAG02_NODE_5189_length_4555_cov_10.704668_3_plen_74_part_00